MPSAESRNFHHRNEFHHAGTNALAAQGLAREIRPRAVFTIETRRREAATKIERDFAHEGREVQEGRNCNVIISESFVFSFDNTGAECAPVSLSTIPRLRHPSMECWNLGQHGCLRKHPANLDAVIHAGMTRSSFSCFVSRT